MNNFVVKSFQIPSSDGSHTLCGSIYIPQGEIKGIFHLVHGMTEYIDRFEPTLSFLAQNGFVAAGYDNLGHGKSVNSNEELGFIAEKDGYKYLIKDVKRFYDFISAKYPNAPYILMGHSMGSFIARLAATESGAHISRLIICGTGGPMAVSEIAPLLTNVIKKIKGGKSYSGFLENLAFGSYNKRFENRTKYDWLTKDTALVDRYIDDPLCGFRFTVSALCDLVTLNRNANRGSWFKALRKDLPLLLISGADDPVGNYGKGVQAVYKKLLATEHNCVQIKLYKNCRHEIHNDSCADEVLKDILKFITV